MNKQIPIQKFNFEEKSSSESIEKNNKRFKIIILKKCKSKIIS